MFIVWSELMPHRKFSNNRESTAWCLDCMDALSGGRDEHNQGDRDRNGQHDNECQHDESQGRFLQNTSGEILECADTRCNIACNFFSVAWSHAATLQARIKSYLMVQLPTQCTQKYTGALIGRFQVATSRHCMKCCRVQLLLPMLLK